MRRRLSAVCVLGLLELLGGRAFGQGLPDLPRETDILVDTPGTTRSVAGGMFNPAAWPIQRGGGLFFGWDDVKGDLADDDFIGVVSTRYLGFGFRQFEHNPAPGDEFHIRDYVIGTGVGTNAGALAIGYGWGGGDLDRQARHERFLVGGVARCRYSSLGLAFTRDLEVDDNLLQGDLGIRPFGPRLTLFGDAVYEHGQSFDDIQSAYGLEVRPLAGMALGARVHSTGEASLRLDIAFGRHLEVGYRPHLDDGGDRTASTYTFEIGPPQKPIGYELRRPRGFPTLELRGPMRYQRYLLFDRRRTLLGTLRRIEAVAQEPGAAGIVVDLSGARMSPEMYWELREQLAGLRARGKKVIVYFDRAAMWGYMLASVADAIWMDPSGDLDLRGLATGRTFMRHSLDKLGLGVDEWRFFTYKSAFESFSRDSMSEPDREQRQALIDDFYEEIAASVTTARGLTRAQWDSILEEKGVLLPEEARAAGLVDSIGTLYAAQASGKRTLVRSRPDASAAVLSGVAGDPVWSPLEWGEAPRIAVLYAIGPCEMESGIRGRILAKAIRAARKDRRVKAVVLRADSPGGDALPSDLVAREMLETSKRKPVIVSQGQVAGSGGYWISMYGDTIVAAPVTITGSIGVIGGWVWNKEFGNKIGFDYDGVKHGRSADLGAGLTLPMIDVVVPDRPLTSEERDRAETIIRSEYRGFVAKVAKGRGLDEKTVDSIGQGRVWSGTRGAKNGLVDELGGLWRSLQIAKAAAGLAPNRGIDLIEGPSVGTIDFSALKPSIPLPFSLWGNVAPSEPAAEESNSTASERPAASAPLSAEELDYLRAILRARGGPVYRMEPFEIEDGSPR